jgi:hypothetical protein
MYHIGNNINHIAASQFAKLHVGCPTLPISREQCIMHASDFNEEKFLHSQVNSSSRLNMCNHFYVCHLLCIAELPGNLN